VQEIDNGPEGRAGMMTESSLEQWRSLVCRTWRDRRFTGLPCPVWQHPCGHHLSNIRRMTLFFWSYCAIPSCCHMKRHCGKNWSRYFLGCIFQQENRSAPAKAGKPTDPARLSRGGPYVSLFVGIRSSLLQRPVA